LHQEQGRLPAPFPILVNRQGGLPDLPRRAEFGSQGRGRPDQAIGQGQAPLHQQQDGEKACQGRASRHIASVTIKLSAWESPKRSHR